MANYTLNYSGTEVDALLNKIDTAYGETTVMGDTLTWDRDMTGKVYAEFEMPVDDEGNTTTAYLVKVSNAIPTFEEVQSGGTITAYMDGMSNTVEWGNDKEYCYTDMGNIFLDESMQLPMIAKEDNVDVMGMFTLPEKGVYIMSVPAMGMYVGSFTINNYTGFETTEVKTIDSKYLPISGVEFVTIQNGESDKTYEELANMLLKGTFVVAKSISDTGIAYVPVAVYNEEYVMFSTYIDGAGIKVKIMSDGRVTAGTH